MHNMQQGTQVKIAMKGNDEQGYFARIVSARRSWRKLWVGTVAHREMGEALRIAQGVATERGYIVIGELI